MKDPEEIKLEFYQKIADRMCYIESMGNPYFDKEAWASRKQGHINWLMQNEPEKCDTMKSKSYVTKDGDRITFMLDDHKRINVQVNSYNASELNFTFNTRDQLKDIMALFLEALQ